MSMLRRMSSLMVPDKAHHTESLDTSEEEDNGDEPHE